MTMQSSADELPPIGFLADVSAEHRSFLAGYGKFNRPHEGDLVIKEGQPQESLYLILSGKLHIVSDTDERPLLLASLGAGDSMGEINLFDPGLASASAVARSEVVVWSLSRSELDAFLADDPAAGEAVLKGLLGQLSQRIRAMNDKLASAESKSSLHDFWNTSSASA